MTPQCTWNKIHIPHPALEGPLRRAPTHLCNMLPLYWLPCCVSHTSHFSHLQTFALGLPLCPQVLMISAPSCHLGLSSNVNSSEKSFLTTLAKHPILSPSPVYLSVNFLCIPYQYLELSYLYVQVHIVCLSS